MTLKKNCRQLINAYKLGKNWKAGIEKIKKKS